MGTAFEILIKIQYKTKQHSKLSLSHTQTIKVLLTTQTSDKTHNIPLIFLLLASHVSPAGDNVQEIYDFTKPLLLLLAIFTHIHKGIPMYLWCEVNLCVNILFLTLLISWCRLKEYSGNFLAPSSLPTPKTFQHQVDTSLKHLFWFHYTYGSLTAAI